VLADTPVGVIPLVSFAAASLADDSFQLIPGCLRGGFSKKLIASDSFDHEWQICITR
jgi:hypothetical protein